MCIMHVCMHMWMCICRYACMCECIRMNVCLCTYDYDCINANMYMHCKYVCVFIYTCIQMCIAHVWICMNECTYICVQMHMNVLMCLCVFVHTCARIHITVICMRAHVCMNACVWKRKERGKESVQRDLLGSRQRIWNTCFIWLTFL